MADVFEEIDRPLLIADRAGRLLFANAPARVLIGADDEAKQPQPKFVLSMFPVEFEEILRGLERGDESVCLGCRCQGVEIPSRVRWLSKSDWLLIQLYASAADPRPGLSRPEADARDYTVAADDVLKNLGSYEETDSSGEVICEPVGEGLYFLAASPAMRKIRKQVLMIGSVNVPVLISGESGSGKEVIARMIHAHCIGRSGPFVKVNCAALPAELLESELFGHEQGAFTGAVRAKPGKFELANHGTIFLDEIGEMSTHLQSKLLHILQDGQFSRLGSRHVTQVDVRVIAATNVDVQEAIRQGRFREDLYYRLNVVPCHLPPLRERKEEIPLLFDLFFDRYQKEFHKEVPRPSGRLLSAVVRHTWRGNVREMENFVKRYVILGDEEESYRELMSTAAEMSHPEENSNGHGLQNLKSMVRDLKDEAEAKAIAEALRQTNWRRKDAARLLGISYKALLYKMRQFGLGAATREVHAASVM
jgi:DNA-binding NtrC family response regulator